MGARVQGQWARGAVLYHKIRGAGEQGSRHRLRDFSQKHEMRSYAKDGGEEVTGWTSTDFLANSHPPV